MYYNDSLMARTKQTRRKSDQEVLRQPGEWGQWRQRNPMKDIMEMKHSEVSARFKSMEYTPEVIAATTLLQLSKAKEETNVSTGGQRVRRKTKKPERYQDESFAKDDTYDRSLGGYKWVSKFNDSDVRLPHRHYQELHEESKLVKDIESERNNGTTKEGYQKDGFIVDSDDY